MNITYLPKDDGLIKTVATWLYNEFGHINPGASLERAITRLSARAESLEVPLTVVAFNFEGAPIGTASLFEENMDTRADLTPWLASVYVIPEERGKRIGVALCERIKDEMVRLGFNRAYPSRESRSLGYFGNGAQVGVPRCEGQSG